MARKKKKKVEIAGATWLDTYADTITLLMTFFVLLFSMSTLDAAKFKEIARAFNSVFAGESGDSILEFDIYNGEAPIIGGEVKDESNMEKVDPNGVASEESTYDEVKEFVQANDLASIVEITSDERGVIIQIKDSILFEVGKAELKADSLDVLNKINALIATLPNNIIIEGHTDNVPISTYQYPSNYELSGARAAIVLRYFTEEMKQNPSRFVFQGYGETKPIRPNDNDENRAKNRRVNILIVANNKE